MIVCDVSGSANVDSTGTIDSAAGLQTALDTAAASGVRAYAAGTFQIGSTVVIKGHADFQDAVFNWTGGAGVAVQIGAGTPGTVLSRKNIVLPDIIETAKPSKGWNAGTTGVRTVNVNACNITAMRINGFETGFHDYALGSGSVYCDIRLSNLDNNKRNLVVGAGAGGWTNSQTYRLGRLAHNSGEGPLVPGTRHVLIEAAANPINGNLFLGGSMENHIAEYALDCAGPYNHFLGCRWEDDAGARIIWQAGATRNIVEYGYSAQGVNETHAVGSGNNRLMSTGSSRIIGNPSTTVLWLENSSSSAIATDTVMAAGATLAGSNPATQYLVSRSGSATRMKRSTDVYDRIRLDHANGRVYLCNGAAEPAGYLYGTKSAVLVGGGAAFAAGTDDAQDLGVAGLRWRDVRLSRGIGVHGATPPTSPPTVTGVRGTAAAMQSLIAALASYGLVTDLTTDP